MQVYGYDENKDTFSVDLSPETILGYGLDPWRLDLFDEEAVALEVEGKQLSFRKLRDLCFVYWRGHNLFVGLMSDGHGTCLRGTWDMQKSTHTTMHLSRVSPSYRSFEWHFTEYLEHFEQRIISSTEETTLIGAPAGPSQWASPEQQHRFQVRRLAPPTHGAFKAFQAKSASAVSLQGTAVTVTVDESERHLYLQPLTFIGEMFASCPVPMVLPDRVNWLFRELGAWRPTLSARTIRQLMREETPKEISFFLDQNKPSIEAYVKRVYGAETTAVDLRVPSATFELNDTRYESIAKLPPSPTGRLTIDPPSHSVDDLFAVKENCVLGSRIALHDLAGKQARRVQTEHPQRIALWTRIMASMSARSEVAERNTIEERLHNEGFTLIK